MATSHALWNNRDQSSNRAVSNNREWRNSRGELSNHNNAVQETRNVSSELNVRLMRRKQNVRFVQRSNSNRVVSALQRQRVRRHNRNRDEWKFHDRSRRFVKNKLR